MILDLQQKRKTLLKVSVKLLNENTSYTIHIIIYKKLYKQTVLPTMGMYLYIFAALREKEHAAAVSIQLLCLPDPVGRFNQLVLLTLTLNEVIKVRIVLPCMYHYRCI